MQIKEHTISGLRIAEVVSDEIVISSIDDGLQLMADLYYQDFDKIVLFERNIVPNFFDLKTGMAGEMLQKFSTYRMKLAIVGNFSHVSSKSLRDFIFESNKGTQVNFVQSLEAGTGG